MFCGQKFILISLKLGAFNMTLQLPLFNKPSYQNGNNIPNRDKFEGAFLFSAIGDALGWPTEFLKPSSKSKSVRNFQSWKKRVGGKWWGYIDEIQFGAYSDDTQLAIALARSISDTGKFDSESFAYEELPLWLQYERGGGTSIKTAARNLVRPRTDWLNNFYRQKDINYLNAGANGAAMRSLPLALVNVYQEKKLLEETFLNAIITHGHPRAIIGAVLFVFAVRFALLNQSNVARYPIVEYLLETLQIFPDLLSSDNQQIRKWLKNLEKSGAARDNSKSFKELVSSTIEETTRYLRAIPEFLQKPPEDYYHFIGALLPETKGSGISTVCAAIYLYLRYIDKPEEAVYAAVNTLGSDTDTIAVFTGAIVGADFGTEIVPSYLIEQLQDKTYITETAQRLHSIASQNYNEQLVVEKGLGRKEAYLRILAWEIGLHEMFWDALEEGSVVIHPTIGKGKITRKLITNLPHEGYVAKLIHIDFMCGQTCVFHSRVKDNLQVSESFSPELEKMQELFT
jgi:ADP-ribosylglycohydrolase